MIATNNIAHKPPFHNFSEELAFKRPVVIEKSAIVSHPGDRFFLKKTRKKMADRGARVRDIVRVCARFA